MLYCIYRLNGYVNKARSKSTLFFSKLKMIWKQYINHGVVVYSSKARFTHIHIVTCIMKRMNNLYIFKREIQRDHWNV